MSKENYIEEIRTHDSAYKHVSGYAEYTDDINEPKNTIYGAIGLSKKAHAIIKNIDLTEVKKSEGVISVVTQSDIPGRNDVGPVFEGDTIYAESEILDGPHSRTKSDRGIVYMETRAFNQKKQKVLTLRRKFLAPKNISVGT